MCTTATLCDVCIWIFSLIFWNHLLDFQNSGFAIIEIKMFCGVIHRKRKYTKILTFFDKIYNDVYTKSSKLPVSPTCKNTLNTSWLSSSKPSSFSFDKVYWVLRYLLPKIVRFELIFRNSFLYYVISIFFYLNVTIRHFNYVLFILMILICSNSCIVPYNAVNSARLHIKGIENFSLCFVTNTRTCWTHN